MEVGFEFGVSDWKGWCMVYMGVWVCFDYDGDLLVENISDAIGEETRI